MSRNVTVDETNAMHLSKIKLIPTSYRMKERVLGNNQREGLRRRPFASKACTAPVVLELKPGAQVMLLRNIDVKHGLCNGARGVVDNIDRKTGYPMVFFSNGMHMQIKEEIWSYNSKDFSMKKYLKTGKSPGWCVILEQIPLRLAYAITIHKSQGCTIDPVVVNFNRMFANAQVYVALSRARSLAGLGIRNFNPDKLGLNKKVVEFYKRIEEKNQD